MMSAMKFLLVLYVVCLCTIYYAKKLYWLAQGNPPQLLMDFGNFGEVVLLQLKLIIIEIKLVLIQLHWKETML